jgi:small subunit ribosomal protein S6
LVSEFERNLGLLDDVLKYQTVLVRKDVDLGALEVNTENLKFEAVEPPAEDEPEESIERQLGLVDSPDRDRHRDVRDADDDFGDVDGPVSDEDDAQ